MCAYPREQIASVRTDPTRERGGGEEGKGRGERRRPPHRVGSGDGKGGGITFMAGAEGKRRMMPKSRGLPANGKKRDGERTRERER